MTLDNYLQETAALATLAGILSGFAFSAVVQFLATERESKLITAAIVVFSAATLMFLYALLVFILLFAAAAEQNSIPTQLEYLGNYALLVIFAAVYIFLSGIGLAGWIRSRLAGAITTTLALITACLTSLAILNVIASFSA
ncbi:MAG: hypothetical protein ACP5QU_08235 [Anaerolineae bacterium]